MKRIILLLLFSVNVCYADVDYDGIVKRAEFIQNEAQSLIDEIESQNVSMSSVKTASVIDIIGGISETIVKLNEAIDEAKKFMQTSSTAVENVSSTVQTSIVKIDFLLADLNIEIKYLIEATTSFIDESTATLNDVRMASEKTVGFVSSFGGRILTSHYGGLGGLESGAEITLWRVQGLNDDNFRYFQFGLDKIESDNDVIVLAGTKRGLLSFGAGYIKDGFGFNSALNEFGDKGFVFSTSLYRLNQLGVDLELGYKTPEMNGVRLFCFTNDILEDIEFGGGLKYESGF